MILQVRVGDHDNSDPDDTDFNKKQTFKVRMSYCRMLERGQSVLNYRSKESSSTRNMTLLQPTMMWLCLS